MQGPAEIEMMKELPIPSAASRVAACPPTKPLAFPMTLRDTRPPPRRRDAHAIESEAQHLEDELVTLPIHSPERAVVRDRIAESDVALRKLGIAGASAPAIDQYESILKETPSYADADAVLYYVGIELEVAGDEQKALGRFQDLLARRPGSFYAPFAEFAIGELRRHDAAQSPAALKAYFEAFEHTDSPIAPAAGARIVELYEATGDSRHADEARARLAREFPSSPLPPRCER